MSQVDSIYASVSLVTIIEKGATVGSASGFFFQHDTALWLITNRHVVSDPNQRHLFDALDLRVHTNPADLAQNVDVRVHLFDSHGQQRWLECPGRSDVDVVAVPLEGVVNPAIHTVVPLTFQNLFPDDLHIGPGHSVLVLGYPRGFHDHEHNLPIVRDAAVGSAFRVPFKGLPCFVIDARLHPGTSGSPVLTKQETSWADEFGAVRMGAFPHYLLGVHSATWLLPGAKDDPSGLNVVWYASLLRDIFHRPNAQ